MLWCPHLKVTLHEQSLHVTLSAAKGLARVAERSFAEFTLSAANGLRMTGLDLAGAEERLVQRVRLGLCQVRMTGPNPSGGKELSRSFEPCLRMKAHAIQ
jgi:hypothetical protein